MRLKRQRLLKYAAAGILMAIPLFGLAGIAQAHSYRTGDNTTVPAGETIHSTLFISGRTIDIAGNVDGDIFCAGQNVTISGHVSGDVICAGQSVRVSGKVDGDIRVAGQDVTLGGSVGHSLSVAGQTVTAAAGSRVDGDVSLAGQTVTLNGLIGRDLSAAADNVTINGQVRRDVQAAVTQLSLGGKAAVDGKIDYTSKNTVSKSASANVKGTITRTEPAAPPQESLASRLWSWVLLVVSMLLLAVALVLAMPRLFQHASDRAMRHIGKTFLIGLASSVTVPIIIVLLFVTYIGAPLAVLLLLSWLVILMLSGPFAAYLLGRYLLRGRSNAPIWTMVAGAVVLLLAYNLPVLGWLVTLVAIWFGLGMVLTTIWVWLRQARHTEVIHSKKHAEPTRDQA